MTGIRVNCEIYLKIGLAITIEFATDSTPEEHTWSSQDVPFYRCTYHSTQGLPACMNHPAATEESFCSPQCPIRKILKHSYRNLLPHERISLNTQKSIVSVELFSYVRCAHIPGPLQKPDQAEFFLLHCFAFKARAALNTSEALYVS